MGRIERVFLVPKRFDDIAERANFPPLRNLPYLGVEEAGGEEIGERPAEGAVATVGLVADGDKVHEPRLEKRPRYGLQRLAHPAVQLDLVVQRAEDVGDRALLG